MTIMIHTRRLVAVIVVVGGALCALVGAKEDTYKHKVNDDLQWARLKEVKKVFDPMHSNKELLPVINIIRSEGQVRDVVTDRKGMIGKLRGSKSRQETLSLAQAAGEILGILYKQKTLGGRNLFSSYYDIYVTGPCKKITKRYNNLLHYIDYLKLFEQKESRDTLSMFKKYVDNCETLLTAPMQAQVKRYYTEEMNIKRKTVNVQSLSPLVASSFASPSASPPSSPPWSPSSSPSPPSSPSSSSSASSSPPASPQQYPPQQYPPRQYPQRQYPQQPYPQQQYPQQQYPQPPPEYRRPPPPDYRPQRQPPPPSQQPYPARQPYPPQQRPQQPPPPQQYADRSLMSESYQQPYPGPPSPGRGSYERPAPPPQYAQSRGPPPQRSYADPQAPRTYNNDDYYD